MEQIKLGQPMFISGDMATVTSRILYYLVDLQKTAGLKKILFLDTLNCLNPYSLAKLESQPQEIFKNIYYARAERPYDLWTRINSSEKFIMTHDVEAILIPSLSYIFKDADKEEIAPLISHMISKISAITKKHRLITIIGNTSHQHEQVAFASSLISHW